MMSEAEKAATSDLHVADDLSARYMEDARQQEGDSVSDDMDESEYTNRSMENVVPVAQLQNGARQAKKLWLAGLAGVKEHLRQIEQSEQVARMKERAAPVLDRAATGLCGVGQNVGAATQRGVKWTEERFEEAKPRLAVLQEYAVSTTRDLQKCMCGTGGRGSAAARSDHDDDFTV